MTTVKTYKGHAVPDGATHYGPESASYHAGFYKVSDRVWSSVMAGSKGDWCQVGDAVVRYDIIKLPQEPEQWMPEPGTYVEVLFNDIWANAWYVGRKEDGSQLYEALSGGRIIPAEVRGVKTERERFIAHGVELRQNFGDIDLLERLFDNGARFSGGEV